MKTPLVRSSVALIMLLMLLVAPSRIFAQEVPQLTQPVNDFANVIDASHAQAMDAIIRQLQTVTGDVVIVATVETFAPFATINDMAVKLFENHGRGIGEKGKDNAVLVLVAVKDRRAWIEVGYGLEQYITDGYAGETTRLYMIPYFKQGDYGSGIEAGVRRIVGRIGEARGVNLGGVPSTANQPRRPRRSGAMGLIFLVIVILSVIGRLMARIGGGGGRWGRGPWSGWSGGVGTFGGGWGGGFGGGGGGGGFGGFGGGGSGGGGGGGSW